MKTNILNLGLKIKYKYFCATYFIILLFSFFFHNQVNILIERYYKLNVLIVILQFPKIIYTS